jgi:hypothetical protein
MVGSELVEGVGKNPGFGGFLDATKNTDNGPRFGESQFTAEFALGLGLRLGGSRWNGIFCNGSYLRGLTEHCVISIQHALQIG